jgi:hypothetical protein
MDYEQRWRHPTTAESTHQSTGTAPGTHSTTGASLGHLVTSRLAMCPHSRTRTTREAVWLRVSGNPRPQTLTCPWFRTGHPCGRNQGSLAVSEPWGVLRSLRQVSPENSLRVALWYRSTTALSWWPSESYLPRPPLTIRQLPPK